MPKRAVAAALMLLLLCAAVPTAAQEATDLIRQETYRLLEQMDLSQWRELLPDLDVEALLYSVAQGEVVWADVALEGLSKRFAEGLRKWAPRMLRIVGVTLLGAGLNQLRGTENDGVSQMMELLAYLCIAVPIAQDCTSFLSKAQEVVQQLSAWSDVTLPTMLALLTAIGGERSTFVLQRTSLLATDGILQMIVRVLLPLLSCGTAVALVSNLSDRIHMRSLLKNLRAFIHWTMGGCFTVFIGLLAIRSTTSVHYDGVTLRAAKYAIDKAIPVVGGVFKDTADTLIGCSLIVKNAVGVVGLTGIVLTLMQPCLHLACAILAYKICASVLEPLGGCRISSALQGFADLMMTLLILLLSAGAMFFVLLSALMRIGMGFV